MRSRSLIPLALFAALAAIVSCSRDPRTPVYVYSPHGREQLLLLEKAFETKYPQYDVRWLDMGSQEILDRLRFEKVNPQADVWFGGPATIFERGITEQLLAPYRPSWASKVDPGGIGPGNFYHPVYRTAAIIAYNSAVVSEAEAPKDWEEVLDPKWKGRVLIRDPMASGTMRAIWGFLIQRSIRETGSADRGWEYLKRLDGQTRTYAPNPALLIEKLARRDGLVTLWDLQDILINQHKGMPFGISFPRGGTVVIDDPIALVRGARHPQAGKAFIEFVATPEAQILAARHLFRLPARLDLDPKEVPEWVAEVEAKMKIAEVNWPLLAKEGGGWMSHWDQEVRGRGNP